MNIHNQPPNLLEIAKTSVTSIWCYKWPIFISPPGHNELKNTYQTSNSQYTPVKIDNGIMYQHSISHLTYCGYVTPYWGIDINQHWFRYWLVTCLWPSHLSKPLTHCLLYPYQMTTFHNISRQNSSIFMEGNFVQWTNREMGILTNHQSPVSILRQSLLMKVFLKLQWDFLTIILPLQWESVSQ